MKMIWVLLLCASVNAHAKVAQPDTVFLAQVVAVLDGDTVMVRRRAGIVRIRLADIDAPEKAQPYGDASRRSLAEMVLHQQVHVASRAVDKYGRVVARLGLNGLDVNAEQVRRGMAWDYSLHHSNRLLAAFQNEARLARRGLWSSSQPTPPWLWRKQHPANYSISSTRQSETVNRLASSGECGSKHYCSQMRSCGEARYYLAQCRMYKLDRNHDGVPCESLCPRSGK